MTDYRKVSIYGGARIALASQEAQQVQVRETLIITPRAHYAQERARKWIEKVMGLDVGDDFFEALEDGVVLCGYEANHILGHLRSSSIYLLFSCTALCWY